MSHKITYPAVLVPDDGGYYVYFPDLPGCFTQCDTIEEAKMMAAEALHLYLDDVTDYPLSTEADRIELANGEIFFYVEYKG